MNRSETDRVTRETHVVPANVAHRPAGLDQRFEPGGDGTQTIVDILVIGEVALVEQPDRIDELPPDKKSSSPQ